MELENITNLANYKIFIHIKKNRRLKRKETYLTAENDFVENINQALEFPDLQAAEDRLRQISRFSSCDTRPRIIIKYILAEPKTIAANPSAHRM